MKVSILRAVYSIISTFPLLIYADHGHMVLPKSRCVLSLMIFDVFVWDTNKTHPRKRTAYVNSHL